MGGRCTVLWGGRSKRSLVGGSRSIHGCLPNLQTAQNKKQPEREILEMEKIQDFTTCDQIDKFSKTEKIQKIAKYGKTR